MRDATRPLSRVAPPPTPWRLRIEARERFLAGRKAESHYALQLRQVAKQIGDLVRGLAPSGVIQDMSIILRSLNAYGEVLQPWAESVAQRMIVDVSRRDATAWFEHGKMIGQALRQEIEYAPTGTVMREALARQVSLITSLPIEAGQRVHKLTLEGISKGTRASEIAAEIMKTGEVTKSRAMTIARTEVSRTSTEFTKARAESIGSTQLIWRTSRDGDVRPSHRQMEGKVCEWANPPTLSDGTVTLPGAIYNCRCFAEPILPDKIKMVQ
jgi:SPP1 gp7 family putative phage head morphogenesis protein